jgi:serine phosphatase RsbU (regulator of sigma subunit)
LSQLSGIHISQEGTTDLEKLTLFLEAARKLNTAGVLDEILMTMLEVTLRLTRAERGYVFLTDDEGKLRLAAGRNSKGEPLLDDKTISHSALEESLRSNSEFLLTDTGSSMDLAARQSIVAYDLRTVICIPLRKRQVQSARDQQTPAPGAASAVTGVLYVDSRFASREFSGVGHDILRAIATEAGSLIENARLVQAEEESRRYQQELTIAAGIQQRLMQVKIPEVPFATLRGKNLSCKAIGGDFFDAVITKEGLAVVLADVSGKGVSAALLASTLQGMVISQLISGTPLLEVVCAVNRFFTEKLVGEKYATVLLARLRSDGDLEYVNCGHVQPLLVCGGEVIRPSHGNVPVGLLADATFESDHCQLHSGDRFFLVTDGVTEAENAMGDFFEDSRLEAAAIKTPNLEGIFSAVSEFCAGNPLNDDCTVVELVYSNPGAQV